MKPNRSILITAMVLVAALASPASLSAQHTRYKLVDLGTFGGPQGYLRVVADTNFYARILNNPGAVTGWADTPSTDPYPNFCFNEDCFVSRAFDWQHGVRTGLVGLADGLSSATAWISANGLIAGTSQNGEIDPLFSGFPEMRAVLWRNGNITDLGTLEGGYESAANAVNSRGEVAGLFQNTIPDDFCMLAPGFCPTQTRAFHWQEGGVMQDLGTLGGTDAIAFLINERGQIVGESYTNKKKSDYCLKYLGFALTTGAFLWEQGETMKNLGSFGGTCTFASDLNNRGQVVGASTLARDKAQHPFLWDGGSIKDLGTFGGNRGNAIAISDTGKIAGWASYKGDTVVHAALWSEEGMTDLGTLPLPGYVDSFAVDVNARGQVIGVSSNSTFTKASAFLWEKGRPMLNLESVLANSHLQLGFGVGNINDRGEIAGNAVDTDNNVHAILLVPCHANDSACQDAAADMTLPLAPATTRPANNQNNAIRQMFRRRLGLWPGMPGLMRGFPGKVTQNVPAHYSEVKSVGDHSFGTIADSTTFTPSVSSTLTGHCEYAQGSVGGPRLTGWCVGKVAGACRSGYDPGQCPVGWFVKSRGWECGAPVDLGRFCTP